MFMNRTLKSGLPARPVHPDRLEDRKEKRGNFEFLRGKGGGIEPGYFSPTRIIRRSILDETPEAPEVDQILDVVYLERSDGQQEFLGRMERSSRRSVRLQARGPTPDAPEERKPLTGGFPLRSGAVGLGVHGRATLLPAGGADTRGSWGFRSPLAGYATGRTPACASPGPWHYFPRSPRATSFEDCAVA
jgi:hypothetical protein